MKEDDIIQSIKAAGLRVTPQRIAIMEAIMKIGKHPAKEQIIAYVKLHHPSISVATVYNILDSFVQNHVVDKVKTENGVLRYDPKRVHHHHLYCTKSDIIEDYVDTELDNLIANYFKDKGIADFKIEDVKLQITGEFNFK
jgi:Fur family peroxide stress response transcriptional regulator